jgi:hypothetical protein
MQLGEWDCCFGRCVLLYIFHRGVASRYQKIRELPKQYSLPDLTHLVKVVVEVMDGGQGGIENFTGMEQVAEIGP